MAKLVDLVFDNTFYRLGEKFFTALPPQAVTNPYLVSASSKVAELIGIDESELSQSGFVDCFSGKVLLSGMQPLAMIYSGHQFGVYNPRLGDGRALLLGEVESSNGHFDLTLKGSGITPYSRMGDGRAVLRSSVREYLCSEAMAGLNIPTTRALCVIGGEDKVYRETVETSAVICRVAPSHVRFGSFEWFYYQNDHLSLKQLADYVIDKHFEAIKDNAEKYALFFQQVVKKTASLIARWQSVGFAHGVMNTDNMSILGLTFDYGPYGFLDDFDPGFICNHSDHSGRYAFNQQPQIGLWNLNALAHVFTPLVDKENLVEILKEYEEGFVAKYSTLLAEKIGLQELREGDDALIQQWLELMAKHRVDYTNTFRNLSSLSIENDGLDTVASDALINTFKEDKAFTVWLEHYLKRLRQQSITDVERKSSMDAINPKYILRNYLVQKAIEKAENERDFSEVNRLLDLLYKPFDEQPEYNDYAAPAPEWGKHLEISCSS